MPQMEDKVLQLQKDKAESLNAPQDPRRIQTPLSKHKMLYRARNTSVE